MMSTYQVGDRPRIIVTFRNIVRQLADPDIVRFRFKTPDGTETTYVYGTGAQVVQEAAGIYHVDLRLTADGEWWYRWEGDGSLACAVEKAIQVDESAFDVVDDGSPTSFSFSSAASCSPPITVTASSSSAKQSAGASAPPVTVGATSASLVAVSASSSPSITVAAATAALFTAAGASAPAITVGATGTTGGGGGTGNVQVESDGTLQVETTPGTGKIETDN